MPDITHPTNILEAGITQKGVENGGSGLGDASPDLNMAFEFTVN
jgi:hypothetical protein